MDIFTLYEKGLAYLAEVLLTMSCSGTVWPTKKWWMESMSRQVMQLNGDDEAMDA